MNKKQVKRQKHITMEEFLRNYCQIENDTVINLLKNLSHHELKIVCMEIYKIPLTRLPFDKVYQEDVDRGDILFVSDSNACSAPYKNPQAKLQEILTQPTKPTNDFEMKQIYEETIDLIEDNLTIEEMNISSVGSFDIPQQKTYKKKGRYYDKY